MDPRLFQFCITVCDTNPTLKQHCVNVSRLLGWDNLVSQDQSTISHMIYPLSDCKLAIRSTLNDSGFPGICLSQFLPCSVNNFIEIERGCHENIPPDMRLCHYCHEDIGHEYHYLLICSHFKNKRKNMSEVNFGKYHLLQCHKNL